MTKFDSLKHSIGSIVFGHEPTSEQPSIVTPNMQALLERSDWYNAISREDKARRRVWDARAYLRQCSQEITDYGMHGEAIQPEMISAHRASALAFTAAIQAWELARDALIAYAHAHGHAAELGDHPWNLERP